MQLVKQQAGEHLELLQRFGSYFYYLLNNVILDKELNSNNITVFKNEEKIILVMTGQYQILISTGSPQGTTQTHIGLNHIHCYQQALASPTSFCLIIVKILEVFSSSFS